jgi:hypothetical protein
VDLFDLAIHLPAFSGSHGACVFVRGRIQNPATVRVENYVGFLRNSVRQAVLGPVSGLTDPSFGTVLAPASRGDEPV